MRAYIVCGSRTFQHIPTLTENMSRLVWEQEAAENIVIIHGDCAGADKWAGTLAKRRGANVIAMPYISALGKRGGPARNRQMLSVLQALREVGYKVGVIAFIDKPLEQSRGTYSMVQLARSAEVPVKIIESAVEQRREDE